MSGLRMATAADETPVFFRAGDDELFGLLTAATVEPNGLCVVHLAGKGPSIATVSRGRMSVLLARRLAGSGFHSLRIEYRGTGDSAGADRQWSITNQLLGEVEGALAWLRDHGHRRFVLVGTCGGARMALEAARHEAGVVGVALLLPPMRDSEPWRRYDTLPARHLVKRLLQPKHLAAIRNKGRRRMYLARARSDILAALPGKLRRRDVGANGTGHGGTGGTGTVDRAGTGRTGHFRWIGPDALHGFEELVGAGKPVLMYFGDEDNDYRDWQEAVKGPVGPVLDRAGALVRIEVLEGRYYDRPSASVAPGIARSMAELFGAPGPGAGP